MKTKLSKTKKIILLGAALGVLVPSIVIPVVLINQNKNEKDQDKEDVLKVIKIVEEKSNSERQITLSNDLTGKIIADNQEEIVKKIKELIGDANLKKVKVEISMEEDKEISPNFEKIVVKISKGNYSQTVKNDKTISVKRGKTASELSLSELNLVKDSLEALGTKIVNVYTSGAADQKITTNKLEILKAIEKIIGYSNIKFDGAIVKVKDSEDLLPANNQQPVAITLVVSKPNVSIEVTGFKAKQMSLSQIATIDINHVKTSLESLGSKIVQVNTTGAIDHKIINNKVKILEEIQKLNGYSNIDLKGVNIEVKDSETLLAASDQVPTPITLVLSKSGSSIEVSGFKAKSLSSQEILDNTQAVNSVKSSLESLNPKVVDVYTSGAADQKITTNKIEILNSIKRINGYSEINIQDVSIQVKESEDVLPANNEAPIPITLVLSKPGVDVEVNVFSAKQMSLSQIANFDINLVKKDLESLSVKIVEVDSSESLDQKITTNKDKILEKIKKLDGYSDINFRSVNIEVKDSDTLLPAIDEASIPVTIVLSKTNASPNDIEVSIFSVKQYSIQSIVTKITDKDILIAPNVLTSNQNELQTAILEQLKVENNALIDKDLEKMRINISSLDIGIRIEVEITITFGLINQTINIHVEKINLLKNSNIVDGKTGKIFHDKFKNLWAMGKDQKLQVLKANQDEDGYVNTGWTDDNSSSGHDLLKGSDIGNGERGAIFQDEFKNLWAIGEDAKLQVLKANQEGTGYVKSGWVNDNDENNGDPLLKNSKIDGNDGDKAIIFQDKFKNLWAMAGLAKLQVLKANQEGTGYVTTGWINDNSSSGDPLLKNSNIDENLSGTVFQDEFKNLWAMTSGENLQVLKANPAGDGYVTTGWIDDSSSSGDPLLKNSNIFGGQDGAIFQDEFKNLWTKGENTKLQVLKANPAGDGYVNTGWIDDNSSSGDPLLKNSNIEVGNGRKIFQDKFKNLWAMATNSKLQVLKANPAGDGYVTTGWIDDNSSSGDPLLKNSNIIFGDSEVIFQDFFGNLWTSGTNRAYRNFRPQVLRVNPAGDGYVTTGWVTNNNTPNDIKLLNGLSIMSGINLVIFQDEFENLWAMGSSVTNTLEDGTKEIIHTKLQVLKINVDKTDYVDSWQV